MKLSQSGAEIYIPDGSNQDLALARTTHLAISAHQDDIEIMAVDGILECFQQGDKWFSGVILTDGRASPRNGIYGQYSDADMMAVRVQEQKRAALVGGYSAQVFCAHPSAHVKQGGNQPVIEDIKTVVSATSPHTLYTHNLADKHPTHVAVAVRVIEALRQLPTEQRPERVFGCEVWRDLGWMQDDEKVVFDCSTRQNLQEALLGVFDSQISGGKRYDLAAMGRRIANATFLASHETDTATGLSIAMDLSPLVADPGLDIQTYVGAFIERFATDVNRMINAAIIGKEN